MPRRTDPSNPADWIWIAEFDLAMVRLVAEQRISFGPCRSKLAEALEKVLKAERGRFHEMTTRTQNDPFRQIPRGSDDCRLHASDFGIGFEAPKKLPQL